MLIVANYKCLTSQNALLVQNLGDRNVKIDLPIENICVLIRYLSNGSPLPHQKKFNKNICIISINKVSELKNNKLRVLVLEEERILFTQKEKVRNWDETSPGGKEISHQLGTRSSSG